MIAAGGYLVVTDARNYGAGSGDPGVHTAFSLSPYGFTVCVSSNANGVAGGYQVQQAFGATPAGISAGLYHQFDRQHRLRAAVEPDVRRRSEFSRRGQCGHSVCLADRHQRTHVRSVAADGRGSGGRLYRRRRLRIRRTHNRSGTTQSLSQLLSRVPASALRSAGIADGTPGEIGRSRAAQRPPGRPMRSRRRNLHGLRRLQPHRSKRQSARPTARRNTRSPIPADRRPSRSIRAPPSTGNSPWARSSRTAPARFRCSSPAERPRSRPNRRSPIRSSSSRRGWILIVGSPTLTSFATQSGLTTLAPGR